MRKTVYITIDDAPSKDFGAKIEYLSAHGIPALIFCVGKQIEAEADALIDAIRRGYVLGNHAYSHPHFSDLPLDDCCEEIVKTDELLDDIYRRAGVARPAKIFRFPYLDKGGHRNGGEYEDRSEEAASDKKAALQSFLRQSGYTQPRFVNLRQHWYRDQRFADDVDVSVTFNQMEYCLGNPDAPYGLSEEAAILARIDEDVPEGGRSLNRPGTADIILIHDMEYTTALFYKIFDRYLAKGFDFRLPAFQ